MGSVARVPVTFVWRAVPDTRNYTLELLTPDGTVAFTTRTSDTVLVTPAISPFAPGEYQWWVRATAADGSTRRSDLRGLRIQVR
jgi:hypothetical protein